MCGIDVDARVDKALDALGQLGETLRGSFHRYQMQDAEIERGRKDDRQRNLEFAATMFLIPTFIVGFYGANVWVPGEHQHWGFLSMLVAIVVFTGTGLALLWRMHRGRSQSPDRSKPSLVSKATAAR